LILKKTSSPSWDLTWRVMCSVFGAVSVIVGFGDEIINEGVKKYYSIQILGGFQGENCQSRFSRIHFYMLYIFEFLIKGPPLFPSLHDESDLRN
jgi:hypothetical protein